MRLTGEHVIFTTEDGKLAAGAVGRAAVPITAAKVKPGTYIFRANDEVRLRDCLCSASASASGRRACVSAARART